MLHPTGSMAFTKQPIKSVWNIKEMVNCFFLFFCLECISMVVAIYSIEVVERLTDISERISQIMVCYDRFQRCAKQFNRIFCATAASNGSFYIWARKMIAGIMTEDGKTRCPPDVMQYLLTGNGNFMSLNI